MMRSPHLAAVILLTLSAGAVRADFMNWSASWRLDSGPTFVSGLSDVALALSPTGPGSGTLNVGNFTTNSITAQADTFNASYGLTLQVTDKTTNDSGELTFHGLISGTTGPSGRGLTNTFSDTSQTLTLDGQTYRVNLDPSTLIPDTNHASVKLDATVSVAEINGQGGQTQGGQSRGPGGPPFEQAPEPNSLFLACAGAASLGRACWKRRECTPR